MKRIASFWAVFCLVFLSLLFISVPKVDAAPPQYFQTTLVAGSNLNGPSGFGFAPDGRIFILERAGKVKIYKNGQVLGTPFADLPSAASGDRGLIGIAFDPDFATNHWVYFWYTSADDYLNRLVRFDASTDVAQNGPVQIFQTTIPSLELHVGGGLAFGPDGKIYLGIGDNGYPPNAQDMSSPFGKIFRINKDGSAPIDNPYVGQEGVLPQIWAHGFRNPWRIQFDPETNAIFESDVGNETWEEVNVIQRGKNYGWPQAEGMCNPGGPVDCTPYTNPLYTYNHDNQSSAVTGGPVNRGSMFPSEYYGDYFFGDYARGFIKRLDLAWNGNQPVLQNVIDFDTQAGSVVDLKQAADGSLYYITYYPGRLYRISYSTTNHIPVANAGADVVKGIDPLTVNFTSAGSYDPNGDALTYAWDFGDGTSSTAANPTKVYTQKGTYTVTLHVSDGTSVAEAVPLVIQVGIPPTVRIAAPLEGDTYQAGDTVFYTASGLDGAGFDLHDADFTTEVLFHHGTHTHPFLGPITSKTGTFTIPTVGEASADTWIEVFVTGCDANGLCTTESVNIYPETSTLSLSSEPAGLTVDVDGSPVFDLPKDLVSVVGFERELNAPLTQQLNGKLYTFDHWSDGGAARHFVTMAEYDTSYTAYFRETPSFTAEYFNNLTLSGTPALIRQDEFINFNWGLGSPDPQIQNDNFSVRWSREQYFPYGRYKFSTASDDGIRLYIDGNLVINKWQEQGLTPYSAVLDLQEGTHTIVLEYFDNYYDAIVNLNWEATPDQPTPSPTVVPTSTGTPAPTGNGSVITVYAAGTPSLNLYPELKLLLGSAAGEQEVATFTNIDGDANAGAFKAYTYTSPENINPDYIKVVFDNDYYDGNTGDDRNVRIDKIVVDGITYQTESSTVSSIGSWSVDNGCGEGFKQSEWLHCGGYFRYPYQAQPTATPTAVPTSTPVAGTTFDVWAAGTPALGVYPSFDLRVVVNGIETTLATFTNINGDAKTASFKKYTYTHPTMLDMSKIRVVYTNDYFDPATGDDRDLRIDKIAVNGVVYQTEVGSVYSIGSWSVDNQCGGGYKSSEWLHCEGLFEYTISPTVTPTPAPSTTPEPTAIPTPTATPGTGSTVVDVYAAGTQALNIFPSLDVVVVKDQVETVIHTFTNIDGNPDIAQFKKYSFTYPGSLSVSDVKLVFTNDYYDNVSGNDRNVRVDKISLNGVDYQTEDASTYSVGSWSPGVQCGGGYKQSEWLHCGGYFLYASPTNMPSPTPAVGFAGEYWSTPSAGSSPSFPARQADFTRTDPVIDFYWGGGSPDNSIPADHFMARWTKDESFNAGSYQFKTESDDGIRVYVDNELIIDQWTDHGLTAYVAQKLLSAGTHTIKVEYYENTHDAVAKLSWTQM